MNRDLSLLLYRTRNLGDTIQTVALSRLLPPASGVYRHRLSEAPASKLLVLNGMFDKDTPGTPGPVLFAGVSGPHFRKRGYLRWIRQSPYPVAARDPETLVLLRREGIPVELTGCVTMTLPRYDGPRRGVLSVDWEGPGEFLTNGISRDLGAADCWKLALGSLDRFRTAEAVYTSRLHVAVPCLAFGTPVWIARPTRGAWHPGRYSILDEMGIDYERLVTADLAPWAARICAFLAAHLGGAVSAGEPHMPEPPARSALPWWRSLPGL